jgi:16S rRNA (guanine966-N2)-methyltransferase
MTAFDNRLRPPCLGKDDFYTMAKHSRKPKANVSGRSARDASEPVVGLRIIGGRFRGRKLQYSGDLRTRPMKDRLREAVFNLVGPSIKGTHALDLFAGTGALGIEAISRGSLRATLIEQHHPTANIIRKNLATLALEQQAEVVPGNVFIWFRRAFHGDCPNFRSEARENGTVPWAVFCSPPYDFYIERADEMHELIAGLIEASPAGSVFLVEADDRFNFQTLPDPEAWNVRSYPPAVVGIYRKME